MYYGIYRNIRGGAWRCLYDFEISSLPVDVVGIARRVGIKIVKNSSVQILCEGEGGRAYFDGNDWVIVYDDHNSTERSRFVIAHELGHIFLGHDMVYDESQPIRQFSYSPKSEEQADAFAVRILCPACVIRGLDLHTAEEIEKYCRVETKIAKARSARMRTLYKRNKFFTDPLEEKVYGNFALYIQDELFKRENAKNFE